MRGCLYLSQPRITRLGGWFWPLQVAKLVKIDRSARDAATAENKRQDAAEREKAAALDVRSLGNRLDGHKRCQRTYQEIWCV